MTFIINICFSSQAGEGSTGSGSSGGGGGGAASSLSMKSSSRQRSPGNLIRTGDAMDEPNNTTNTAEPEEFVPNIHPPTDDEGVCIKIFSLIQEFEEIILFSNKALYEIINVYINDGQENYYFVCLMHMCIEYIMTLHSYIKRVI